MLVSCSNCGWFVCIFTIICGLCSLCQDLEETEEIWTFWNPILWNIEYCILFHDVSFRLVCEYIWCNLTRILATFFTLHWGASLIVTFDLLFLGNWTLSIISWLLWVCFIFCKVLYCSSTWENGISCSCRKARSFKFLPLSSLLV